MSESVLADFVGSFFTETGNGDEPLKGRVLVSDSQIVLAGPDDESRIPTADVFDVNVGTAPQNMGPFPGTPVTIAYKSGSQRVVAVVAGADNTVEKFQAVLFKALLGGKQVTLKHPARVGGRVTDATFEPAKVALTTGSLSLHTRSGSVDVDHTAVIDFSRAPRQINGETRTTLSVKHMSDGAGETTHVATRTPRTSSLLGRYLRRRYDELVESLDDVSLSKQDVEALTTIYTVGGSPEQLVSVLDDDPAAVKQLVSGLESEGLVTARGAGVDLTTRGQVVVNHYMAKING